MEMTGKGHDLRLEMNRLEAMLFASGDPVSVSALAEALGIQKEECRILANQLMKSYQQRQSGIRILQLEDQYQMTTNPAYYPDIVKLYKIKQQTRLTNAQMEVLSIVAYRQPVTRQEINDIRGVSSDAVISRLIELKLIEENGRLKAPGRPVLLATTDEFLRHFGLSSIKDLPDFPPEKNPEADSLKEVSESADDADEGENGPSDGTPADQV